MSDILPTSAADQVVWEQVRIKICSCLGNDPFEQWFGKVRLDGIDKDVVCLSVSTPFLRLWIRDHYLELIESLWGEMLGRRMRVMFSVRGVARTTDGTREEPKVIPAVLPVVVRPQQATPLTRMPPLRIADIQYAVAQRYGLTIEEMLSRSRKRRVVRARQIGMYLAKELTSQSLEEIGKCFGGFGFATVINAVRKIRYLIRTDAKFAMTVNALKEALLR